MLLPPTLMPRSSTTYFISIDGGDDLYFDGNRSRQLVDLDGRSTRLIFRKILCVHAIVRREIIFHVRQKNCYIDNLVPRRAGVFEDIPYVLKHRSALHFDIVR